MKILIVDYEITSRTKLHEAMECFGDCEAADKSNDALQFFKSAFKEKKPFDIITIEYNMPEMNGAELLSQIRKIESENDIQKKVKAIMVTGSSDKMTVIKSIKAGCNEYIVKPII